MCTMLYVSSYTLMAKIYVMICCRSLSSDPALPLLLLLKALGLSKTPEEYCEFLTQSLLLWS